MVGWEFWILDVRADANMRLWDSPTRPEISDRVRMPPEGPLENRNKRMLSQDTNTIIFQVGSYCISSTLKDNTHRQIH